jgi:hypothetical protein
MANFVSCGWFWIFAGILLLAVFGQLNWLMFLIPVAVVVAIAAQSICKHEADHYRKNGVA